MTETDGPSDTTGDRASGGAGGDPDPDGPDDRVPGVAGALPAGTEWWKHTGIPGCCGDRRLSGPELKEALHALGRKVDAHLKRLGW